MSKTCERCGVEIPETYGNALCDTHYAELEEAQKTVKETVRRWILDPAYKDNPEADDKEQWAANIGQFRASGVLLWRHTRGMYEWIRRRNIDKITKHPQYPKYIWKPSIVDVGCGIGVGSNVLSNEADFVWGIDKNENSIKFAKEAFAREKNNIYYSPQLTFDRIDIINDTREFMKFDQVVAIEIIEHIADTETFLKALKRFAKAPRETTEFFISTPNRNAPNIQQDHPKNPYHVREWTSQEFAAMLKEFFSSVELHDYLGNPVPNDTATTPMIALCS